tara:strand:+ start:605 stop:1390 length:786 start_codon:yes stop_codon:yes gene_type:complete
MINWEWTEKDSEFLYELCEKLRDETPFAFSRWGDGEWATLTHDHTPIDKNNEVEMASTLSKYISDVSVPVDTFVGDGKANIDGNIFYKELGNRLKDIVSVKQDYYMGYMNSPFTTMWGEPIYDVMNREYPQKWVNSDILHGFSVREGLSYLCELFETIYVVYVGNESLRSLPFINKFVEIPYNNVWIDYENVLDKIKSLIAGGQHKTFLFSAGMATNVFIDDLWKYSKNNTYMDVGSVFDPYVGRKSRGYHNTLTNVEVFK